MENYFKINVVINTQLIHISGIVECYDFKTKTWSSQEESQNKLVYPTAIWEHVCQQLFVPKVKEDDL